MQSLKIILVTLLASFSAFAQQSPILGNWQTKDKAILNFAPCGAAYCARYVAAKQGEGHLIAKEVIPAKNNTFTGIVMDPDDNNKEYKATWTLSADQKTLTLSVKYGFLKFNEAWKRVP